MKKLIALSALLLSFAVGCQQDISVDSSSGERDVVLNVSLASTRVSLGVKEGDVYPAFWDEGDRLVVNGVQSNEAVIDAENRAKATFSFAESTHSVGGQSAKEVTCCCHRDNYPR